MKGLGGAERVDQVRSLITKHHTQQSTHQATIVFPDKFRLDNLYGASQYVTAADRRGGFFVESQASWPMDGSVHQVFQSVLYREPLAIVKARRRPDFRACAAGSAKVGQFEVDLLRVSFAGTTTTLGVATDSGKILSLSYRGRPGLAGPLGNYTAAYSDFRETGGLVIPFTASRKWNDRDLGARAYDSVEVNSTVDPALFVQPK